MASIRDVDDPAIANYLTQVDASSGSKKDGEVTKTEAATNVRRLQRLRLWQERAQEAFGVVPRTADELLSFAERPPRQEALERILGTTVAGATAMAVTGNGREATLGRFGKDVIGVSSDGRITLNGSAPRSAAGLERALFAAAQMTSRLGGGRLTKTTERLMFKMLSNALDVGLTRPRTQSRDQIFASSMTLLSGLYRNATSEFMKTAIMDRALQALHDQPDRQMRRFYMRAYYGFVTGMDAAQGAAWNTIREKTIRTSMPVEAYTENRSKPLEVRHTIHEEFWTEELRYYSKKNGWTRVDKGDGDGVAEFVGVQRDPDGIKPDLNVHVIVRKGEFDFLQDMGDPDAHCLLYSGHNALGGNSSNAIVEAPKMRGIPKTVMVMNCRFRDNHPEFVEKFPDANLIYTNHSTYSDPEHTRVRGFYEMAARGENFAWMREKTNVPIFDERADNYIFPDEEDRAVYDDEDVDGKIDQSADGDDMLFDVRQRKRVSEFTRAIAFANAELYWHPEVERENGKRPVFDEKYYDHVIPAGPLDDAKPGEVVRVTEERRRGESGSMETFFRVQFDPKQLMRNRDTYAGVVTANVMLAVSREHFGELTPFEIMRAVLMGAQGVHYLDVYDETSPKSYAAYWRYLGMPAISQEDIEQVFTDYDSHANNAHVQGFIDMLREKYDFDPDTYVMKNGDASAPLPVA